MLWPQSLAVFVDLGVSCSSPWLGDITTRRFSGAKPAWSCLFQREGVLQAAGCQ